MSEGINLAKAYVQIIPSANGISGNIAKVLDPEAEAAGKSSGGKLLSGIGSVLKTGGAVIGAGLAAAAGSIASLSKEALSAYADFEQLTGGVETLFKDSADIVMQYADDAYRTAGLSANEYMETVTSFSASLLQSLDGDTAAAAEYAQTAIVDMADNANKMGTSMESIQNAYQGFAKQNFTMLDNLKLGYGGTKAEMERLLEDAMEISGVEYDISSYADIVAAIHVVQKELRISGITAEEAAEAVANGTMTEEEAFEAMGTTAKEASTTISGSVASMKSAWSNFLTSMNRTPGDMKKATDALVNSVVTSVNNIVPKLTEIVPNIVNGLSQVVQALMPQIPIIINSLLPALVTGATELLQELVKMLPQLLSALSAVIPNLIDAILTTAPLLLEAAVDIIIGLVDALVDNLDLLISAALQLILALGEGLIAALPKLMDKIPEIISKIVSALVTNLPVLIEVGIELILALTKGLVEAIPQMLLNFPIIIKAIVTGLMDGVGKLKGVGGDLVSGLWEGIKNSWSSLVSNVKELGGKLIDGVKGIFGIHSPSTVFANIGEMCDEGLAVGLSGMNDTMASTKKMLSNELGGNFGLDTNVNVQRTLSQGQNYSPVASEGSALGNQIANAVYSAISGLALNAEIKGTPNTQKFFDSMRVEAKLYKNRTGQEAFV